MRLFLKLFSYLLTPFIYILVKKRVYKGLDDPIRYKERFGITNVSPKKNADVIWFHAASIGESVSILPILNEWRIQRPQDQILVTTVTKTSAKIMQDRMPKGCIHQYVPFDLTHWVCRFLNHWRPKKLIVVESEFWLNMILESHNRGIKIFNINGKLSDASFKFWTKY
ncbi:MAG TPA: 3-deoxy-D-manno-octulosonic acid transferase, partial [Holosporales bacterium]|nr:3-deoxy-D-manno-octulosonic acid transferase [Holosporales bacterium]